MKHTTSIFRTLITAGFLSIAAQTGAHGQNTAIKSYTFEGKYEDAVLDLADALTNKGLVVDNKAHVANMLNRTAKDIGATKTVYKKGEVIEFCSAKLSRAAMEADPINMAFCPYRMFVYETTAKPGKITVGFQVLNGASNPASKKALDAVNKLLDDMVRETAGVSAN